MKKNNQMAAEYDFSEGIRGKYAKKYREGTNLIPLDADISPYFPDRESVNEALRSLIKIILRNNNSTTRSSD